jgi:hypothetical protein
MAGLSTSRALMELEQVQVLNEVSGDENICEFSAMRAFLTAIIHNW